MKKDLKEEKEELKKIIEKLEIKEEQVRQKWLKATKRLKTIENDEIGWVYYEGKIRCQA